MLYQMHNAPDADVYVHVLQALGDRVKDVHLRLFGAHFSAPGRTASTTQLAAWAGIPGGHQNLVNLYMGKLGHSFCDELGITPDLGPYDKYIWWSVWSRGFDTPHGFRWQMLPQVAEALMRLGWVQDAHVLLFGEASPQRKELVEGALRTVLVNAYERNPRARELCIQAHGTACCICGFNFAEVYGPVAQDFIHVHHLKPLSETGGEYVIDPVADLRPVCPNCHAVLHLRSEPYSIEQLRSFLRPGSP